MIDNCSGRLGIGPLSMFADMLLWSEATTVLLVHFFFFFACILLFFSVFHLCVIRDQKTSADLKGVQNQKH